ncbi:MAG: hypothetical protein NTW74_20530, partial [Acidobacteria bacterium]|nr:hypothetical protein [Acidobacteriota bacterium]
MSIGVQDNKVLILNRTIVKVLVLVFIASAYLLWKAGFHPWFAICCSALVLSLLLMLLHKLDVYNQPKTGGADWVADLSLANAQLLVCRLVKDNVVSVVRNTRINPCFPDLPSSARAFFEEFVEFVLPAGDRLSFDTACNSQPQEGFLQVGSTFDGDQILIDLKTGQTYE